MTEKIDALESLARVSNDFEAVFALLQQLPLDLVADILLHVPEQYPGVRKALPAMPPEQVQLNWTGAAGYELLIRSCTFIRAVENNVLRATGRSLQGMTVLDYGCGWGRHLRLMYKFTSPERLYGCDPWDRSIELCHQAQVRANLAVSDYLPSRLPFGNTKFDLIYAFSVFTHLSERAAAAAMAACRQSIKQDGCMVITIRPMGYWDHHDLQQNDKVDRTQMKQDHAAKGYAFTPHNRVPVDGDLTYGDTSMSFEYMEANWKEWEIIAADYFLQDPHQILVLLKPR